MFGVAVSLHHTITYPMIYLVVLYLSIIPLHIQWYIWCFCIFPSCCIAPSCHYISNDIFGVAVSLHHAITYPMIYLVLLYLSIIPLHIQWYIWCFCIFPSCCIAPSCHYISNDILGVAASLHHAITYPMIYLVLLYLSIMPLHIQWYFQKETNKNKNNNHTITHPMICLVLLHLFIMPLHIQWYIWWCCCISPSCHYPYNDIFGVAASLHHAITHTMIYLVLLHLSIIPLPIQWYIWCCCIFPSRHYLSSDIFGVAVSLHRAITYPMIFQKKKLIIIMKKIKIKGTPTSTATWISRNNANKKWCCCISPSYHYPSNDIFGVAASLHHAITYPMIYLVLLHLSIMPLHIQWYIWCCCISRSRHYISNDMFGVAASLHHAITYPMIYLVLLHLSIMPLHIQWYIWCCCISPSFHYIYNDIFGVAVSLHHSITYTMIYLVLLYLSIIPLHIQWYIWCCCISPSCHYPSNNDIFGIAVSLHHAITHPMIYLVLLHLSIMPLPIQ